MSPPSPPSPSPPPRLRRSPKRQALHERSHSHTNEVLAPTIRPVTDEDLKVYATSPFPTSASQRFPPRAPLDPHPSNFAVSEARNANAWPLWSESNTPTVTSCLPELDRGSFINANAPPAIRDDFFAQHGPLNPKPSTAHAASTSRPPGEDREEYEFYTAWSGIDVDRLVMDRGLNVDNDHHEPPPPPSRSLMNPSSSSYHAGSPHGKYEPPSPHTPGNENRASLGAIASVASALSLQSIEETPATVGSADSSGTVVRRKGFTGPTPPGFYRLFPPRPQSQDGSDRQRSSSAPPRPMTMISEAMSSPDSHGSPRSPVSPISPSNESSSSHGRVYYAPAFARSETSIDTLGQPDIFSSSQPPSRSNSVLDPTADSQTAPPAKPGFSIPRKPVGRSNAVRWNEYMPTIQSQSTDERVDGWVAERSMMEGDPRTETAPSSIGYTGRHSSTASGSFSIPEPLFSSPRASQRESSGATVRVVPNRDRELPSIPSRPPERVKSPTSIYSRRTHRDSDNQTDSEIRTSKRGSLLRDSVPAWARYSFSFLSDYDTDNFDSMISRDFAPGKVESPNSRSESVVPSKPSLASSNDISSYYFGHRQLRRPESPRALQAAKLGFKIYANIDQRLYYANEAGNRDTIGRPLSRADSRRYTVASETPARDSIRIPPARPRENRYMQYDPDVIEPAASRGVPAASRNARAGSGTGSGPGERRVSKSRRSTRPRPDSEWSPHLYYNRTSAIRRRSIFQAPSIDEESEGTGPSKRNVQIWCFALGFVFPPGK